MVTIESLLTASAVLDRLVNAGAREVFFCPGSRSAPFVYAAAAVDGTDLRTHVRLDERSAAFHALGAAKATGRPAVVVTTSGTAVGNLMPAAMEADHAEVPLILLTADRPPELRGTGANQTTRQDGIFGSHVRAVVDVVIDPALDPHQITAQVHRAMEPVLAALNDDGARVPGPVHINVALREPLQPALDDAQAGDTQDSDMQDSDMQAAGRNQATTTAVWAPVPVNPSAAVPVAATDLAQTQLSQNRQFSQNGEGHRDPGTYRTVILAGDGAGEAARHLAETLGLPLMAEPSSNARCGTHAIGPYRLLLDTPLGVQIERVLLMGRPTLSRPVGALLARPHVQTAAWQPRAVAWYDEGRRRETVVRTLSEVLDFTGRPPQDWLDAWQRLGAVAQTAINQELDPHLQEHEHAVPAGAAASAREVIPVSNVIPGPVVAREVWAACRRDGSPLVAGSSNPIRDLDLCADPGPAPGRAGQDHQVTVMANRGLAGIDGTVATAAGAALATGQPMRALMGDVTFLHDAGSLTHLVHETQPDLQIVVLDDRGGGIFNTLEHGSLGEQAQWAHTVERFFGTEPAVQIPTLCAAYGVPVQAVTTVEDLHRALEQPPAGVSVVVVAASRAGLRFTNARIKQAVTRAAADLP
ncbi:MULTISPECIES: 2-succinyl-5-enolpyruvyl-6-hydroxy-3-cyclohexene-1-carboxylic-acid synthase [Kocuria]|uniref:2-succinyl-5-enolpyruvyl-6-hydroxy-3- cyclohexene-1-carboxylic-acid synthase n=1 Tax=Kocuria TaxID=57493 RepID=UPI001ADFE31F|nr:MULTISPECIES: 2-succinyl-5-enolpyruvyl-6-hydroxy-3-cyclohexene-1-carboxylic-acid synthase [Kocuria]